jgi:hypothetical protein
MPFFLKLCCGQGSKPGKLQIVLLSHTSKQLVGSKIGLVDWMEQAKTMLLRDKEEQASPDDGHDSLCSKMVHEASATLDGVNDQKEDNEGLFAGKKTDRQSLGLVVQCHTWCCLFNGRRQFCSDDRSSIEESSCCK